VIGGFNRKWGLPLPQTPVARAGSVYTFQAEGDIPAAKLTALLAEGIGERRVEGFGRLACNWHARHERLRRWEPEDSRRHEPPKMTGEGEKLARRMAGRMLRRELSRQLRQRVNNLSIQGDISNSQLSQVRVLIRSALPTQDCKPILDFLDAMRKTARDQFEKARVDGQSLKAWVVAVLDLDAPEQTWERLFHTSFDKHKLPAVGGVAAKWSKALAREYALRLVDGVLSKKLEERRRSRR
jgi:CRISPR-associated protein Csx10